MLLADRDLKIIYVNPASLATLRKLERYLPVKPENVLGSSIDIFHKNPAHQRKILANDKNLPVRANIKIGPETADLLVTAIYDKNKNYIGPMVTWELITEKLETERKIQEAAERERVQAEDLRTKVDSILEVVNAASRGDLTREMQVKGADADRPDGRGAAKFLATCAATSRAFRETAQTLASSSRQLTAVSQQMAANAEETAAQANVASAAAEQVSKNVTTVATGAEEMGASIKEIAKNANEAARVATSAVKVAEKTNATVAKLGEIERRDRQRHQGHHVDRPADQPAGPERHHRGGPRRRGGQGLRRRRQRGQGAGQADRQGHRGHQPQDRGHPGRHQGRRRGHRPDRQDHQPDQRHPEHHRQRRRGADGHDRRDQPQRRRGGQGQQRDRPEHHRRGPGRPQHHRGGQQHQETRPTSSRKMALELAETGGAVQVLNRLVTGPGWNDSGRPSSRPTATETPMRALVIDDSRAVRIIIRNILREIGMEVVEAGNGREALEQLQQNPDVELVLVDWNMPEMNGLDFIRAVRSQRAYDAVRIVMVTTETESEQVDRALKAGANEYLMKPFNKEVLVAKLNLLDVFEE